MASLNAGMTLPEIVAAAQVSPRYHIDNDYHLLTDWLDRLARVVFTDEEAQDLFTLVRTELEVVDSERDPDDGDYHDRLLSVYRKLSGRDWATPPLPEEPYAVRKWSMTPGERRAEERGGELGW